MRKDAKIQIFQKFYYKGLYFYEIIEDLVHFKQLKILIYKKSLKYFKNFKVNIHHNMHIYNLLIPLYKYFQSFNSYNSDEYSFIKLFYHNKSNLQKIRFEVPFINVI